MADHTNTNGLVDGNIPAGHACPFADGCLSRIAWCPVDNDTLPWPFSCATARAYSMVANETPAKPAPFKDAVVLDRTPFKPNVELMRRLANGKRWDTVPAPTPPTAAEAMAMMDPFTALVDAAERLSPEHAPQCAFARATLGIDQRTKMYGELAASVACSCGRSAVAAALARVREVR